MTKRTKYVEPSSYFPKEIRKKAGIGEYAEKEAKKTNAKEAKSKKK